MRKIKSILAAVAVLTIIFGTQVFSNSNTKEFHLEKGQSYSYLSYKSTGTDKFDYRIEEVKPDDNTIDDTYKRIKIGLKDEDMNWIMSERVVIEDEYSTISYNYSSIINLSTSDPVVFTIRGNDPKLGAYATVYRNWY